MVSVKRLEFAAKPTISGAAARGLMGPRSNAHVVPAIAPIAFTNADWAVSKGTLLNLHLLGLTPSWIALPHVVTSSAA